VRFVLEAHPAHVDGGAVGQDDVAFPVAGFAHGTTMNVATVFLQAFRAHARTSMVTRPDGWIVQMPTIVPVWVKVWASTALRSTV